MSQRNDYTATASQAVFDFTFKIFETDEIYVYQNGSLLTETTDYTVAITGTAPNTGTITLVTGATAGDAIALVQAIPFTRLIEYQTDGDMAASTFNSDFDRLYILLQSLAGTDSADPDDQISDRLVRFATSEDRSGKTNLIPTPVNGQYLGWSSGDLTNLEAPSVSVTDAPSVTNVAALKALDVNESTSAYIQGKNTANDGGQGWFSYKASNTETDDGENVVTPNSGSGRWVRQNNGYNSIYTAVAGGTADAITVATNPLDGVTLDSTRLFVIENTAGPNTSTTPTITFNSLSALTMKDSTGGAVLPGATGQIGNKMLIAVNNAASAAILLNAARPMTGMGLRWFTGLAPTNDTDADHDVSVGAGAIMDATEAVVLVLPSTMVKRIDATWASGTGNGGLSDQDSLSNNMQLNMYLMAKADGTTDLIFATSNANALADTAAAAAGYIYARRIHSFFLDGSKNILPWYPNGNRQFLYDVMLDSGASISSGTRADVTVKVPVSQKGIFHYKISHNSANAIYGIMTAKSQTDTTPTASVNHVQLGDTSSTPGFDSNIVEIRVNGSRVVSHREVSASYISATASIYVLGWEDDITIEP